MSSPSPLRIAIDFAHFELYEHYLVATIHEGVIFDTPQLHKFHEIFDKHYYNRPFGYISNRKNDYTINPTCYIESKKYDTNIVGIATLCYSEVTFRNATFAERFFEWPHRAFYTMEECVDWIESLLKNAGL